MGMFATGWTAYSPSPRPSPRRLCIPHKSSTPSPNPEGIVSSSPATVLIVKGVHAAFNSSVCAPAVSEGRALMQ
jgi:hypothetical protein